MSIITDEEIRESLGAGLLGIEPFRAENLMGASYDARVGRAAIVARSISLDDLKGRVERGETTEIDVERSGSVTIPAGGFALLTTREQVMTSGTIVGHIGMKTYYIRKGLLLLSGLQIDPWWDGVLVLGLANVSPRSITVDYEDDLCTLEFHRLARPVSEQVPSPNLAEQREGKIPRQDRDYLRTIETMSVSDLTTALQSLSRSVESLGKEVRYFWAGFLVVILLGVVSVVVSIVR